MKKALSVFLAIMLIMGMVLIAPFSASAITVEEMDTDDTISAFFDFEDKNFMQVGSQSQTSSKVSWQIDPVTVFEYYYSGWGLASIGTNPVTGETGVEGTVVNASANALQAKKTTLNSWGTGGGIVINRKTENGVEPLILEDNTTYTVEFDYIMVSGHLYGYQVDPNDGTNSATISETVADQLTFGYGYQTTTSTQLAPVQGPVTKVATIASYKPSVNADGYYTAYDGTKPMGSWYHESFTFTTGTFESIYSETDTNKPFLIFYANMYSGAHMMVDNIRVSKNVTVNFHGNGGTVSAASDSGKVGDTIEFPTATKFGYQFTGWYTDGSCTVPFDTTFTKANAGGTAFAGWTKGIESFENYVDTGMNTDRFSVSSEQAYIGSKSMKYSWSKVYIDISSKRTSNNNYFPIMQLENNGETSTTYKLTFKYYIGSVDMKVQPAIVTSGSNSTSITKLGSVATLSSSGTGRWQTQSMIFTVTNSSLATYPNLALHAYANSDTTTSVYFDDFELKPIQSGTSTGTLTVYGGAGNAAGATSRTVGLAVGDIIDSAFVYNGGYAVEGWYTDSALTTKVPANVYTLQTAVYPKFSDRVDLTADGTASRTNGFAKANYEDVLYYNGTSGTASLAQVTSGNTYMVEFLYKNTGSANVTLTAESGSFIAQSGKSDKWYKGYIPVTAASTGALTLSASGSSSLEIKDVYIKDLTGKVYIIFDTTEYGGEITAVYGVAGETISFPANPIVSGKQFSGWYNGSTKFTDTVFPSASVSLTATMVLAGGTLEGDCDGDGVSNTVDLAKMKLYLAKVDSQISEGADMNGDGKVNAIDLVLLYKKLAGQ